MRQEHAAHVAGEDVVPLRCGRGMHQRLLPGRVAVEVRRLDGQDVGRPSRLDDQLDAPAIASEQSLEGLVENGFSHCVQEHFAACQDDPSNLLLGLPRDRIDLIWIEIGHLFWKVVDNARVQRDALFHH